jgi:endonuclease/exonuclease/phosphatase (EEP) superfamily protein YafD
MTGATIALVVAGVALSVAWGVARGVDAIAAIMLSLIVAVGVLAVAVAWKANAGSVGPVRCRACRGLNSPSSPYCKHCGEPMRV